LGRVRRFRSFRARSSCLGAPRTGVSKPRSATPTHVRVGRGRPRGDGPSQCRGPSAPSLRWTRSFRVERGRRAPSATPLADAGRRREGGPGAGRTRFPRSSSTVWTSSGRRSAGRWPSTARRTPAPAPHRETPDVQEGAGRTLQAKQAYDRAARAEQCDNSVPHRPWTSANPPCAASRPATIALQNAKNLRADIDASDGLGPARGFGCCATRAFGRRSIGYVQKRLVSVGGVP